MTKEQLGVSGLSRMKVTSSWLQYHRSQGIKPEQNRVDLKILEGWCTNKKITDYQKLKELSIKNQGGYTCPSCPLLGSAYTKGSSSTPFTFDSIGHQSTYPRCAHVARGSILTMLMSCMKGGFNRRHEVRDVFVYLLKDVSYDVNL